MCLRSGRSLARISCGNGKYPAQENRSKVYSAYLKQPIKFCGAHHVAARAREVTWAVANTCCSNGFAFTSSQLQDQFALVVVFWLKDSEWRTSIGLAPVGEPGVWR